MREEKDEMAKEMQSLEEENKRLLDLLIKHSKGEKTGNSHFTSNVEEQREATKRSNYSKGVLSEQDDFLNYQVNQNLVNSLSEKQPSKPKPKDNNSHIMNTGLSTMIGAAGKTLTLKQLKDFIEEIYESKVKFDQKALENKLPKETMEQHMYTYLNQKYGLKSLIIEWATSIINGIRKFSLEDNDVAVFGKILRNECDEEFRFVQKQVKNTISELLKVFLLINHTS